MLLNTGRGLLTSVQPFLSEILPTNISHTLELCSYLLLCRVCVKVLNSKRQWVLMLDRLWAPFCCKVPGLDKQFSLRIISQKSISDQFHNNESSVSVHIIFIPLPLPLRGCPAVMYGSFRSVATNHQLSAVLLCEEEVEDVDVGESHPLTHLQHLCTEETSDFIVEER